MRCIILLTQCARRQVSLYFGLHCMFGRLARPLDGPDMICQARYPHQGAYLHALVDGMSRMRRFMLDKIGVCLCVCCRLLSIGASSAFAEASQAVVDGLYLRARKLTMFNNELARQAAVHCPRVSRCVCSHRA